MVSHTGTPNGAKNELEARWGGICRVLFSQDIGGLDEYEGWLSQTPQGTLCSPSSVSGKEVFYSIPNYPKGSKRISFDEVDWFSKEPAPKLVGLTDIKSIVSALKGRIAYSGSVVLGNCGHVEKSSNVMDCFYTVSSGNTQKSRYLFHSHYCSGTNDNAFSCANFGESSFILKSSGVLKALRCFEVSRSDHVTDCYYSHGLSNCSDCMFSFNLKNKKYAVFNTVLSREEYLAFKKRLVAEMADMLKAQKRLPSLIEFVTAKAPKPQIQGLFAGALANEDANGMASAAIEKEFSKATALLLGKELLGIKRHEAWLKSGTCASKLAVSAADGRKLMVFDYADFMSYPQDRLVSQAQAAALDGKLSAGPAAAGASFKDASALLGGIALFSPEWIAGTGIGSVGCPINLSSSSCLECGFVRDSKFCAHSHLVINSQYVFGSREVKDSSFCLKCYQSNQLTRCFEVDASRNCSDLYFSHNCENVKGGIFCFNIKNKSYAVGNVEVGKQEFERVKAIVLREVIADLEAKGGCGIGIFALPGIPSKP